MLSKPATMLLGLIYEKPLNAYEIIKLLNYMNVKWWFNIADSTVYSTLKTLEKKEYIIGTAEKVGNMPDRTVYNLSEKGKDEFISTLKASILSLLTEMREKTEVSDDEFAERLATAIDDYIRSATVTVAAGIAVATSGGPSSQTGTTTATGTGTIS